MKIVLDNIIFRLQNSGGISILWGELINNFDKEDISFLDYADSGQNIVRKNLSIPKEKNLIKTNENVKYTRYLNPGLSEIKSKFVFISSYYRTTSNKNALNVSIVHDFTYEHFSKGLKKKIHSLQKRKAIKNSDLIICISQNTRNDLLKFNPKIDPNKIKVIYNGVANVYNNNTLTGGFQEIDENLSFLNQKKAVLFVGGRNGYKNFVKVVEAMSLLNDKYHLIIVGEPLSQTEKSYLNRVLGVKSYTVMERINNETLSKVYKLSHVLVYSSAYEGFGIPILEAMKSGLPVIAYNASSIPEVVGNAGILLQDLYPETIKDAIITLDDEDIRRSLIEKGLFQAEKFSWTKTMDEYKKVIKELVNEK